MIRFSASLCACRKTQKECDVGFWPKCERRPPLHLRGLDFTSAFHPRADRRGTSVRLWTRVLRPACKQKSNHLARNGLAFLCKLSTPPLAEGARRISFSRLLRFQVRRPIRGTRCRARVGFFAPPRRAGNDHELPAGHGDVLWMKTPEGLAFISSNGA